jgi:hypothetical protein
MDKVDIVYTPKHGSWLNMAEIELSALNLQCLNRRIDNIKKIESEILAWTNERNNAGKPIKWKFTTDEARINYSIYTRRFMIDMVLGSMYQ